MATQTQNSTDTVEPWVPANRKPALITRFEERLAKLPCGRSTLSCLQWFVASALVFSGFYGAEVINNGVEIAMRDHSSSTPQVLVAAASPTAHE